jgi:hypothetical protein
MVFSLQRMIENRRERLEPSLVEHFNEHNIEAWNILKPRENLYWFFSPVVLLSTVVVTWLVLAQNVSVF